MGSKYWSWSDSIYTQEGPIHQVNIEKTFYIGKYEVTQKQWHEVMGNDPSYFKGDDLPVEQVSWNEVREFIRVLNGKENSDKYRLPSEAEWEYVARAGTSTDYYFGDSVSELGDYAWYQLNSEVRTHPIGQKMPNSWGLYDIYGNVWELIQDDWHSNYVGAPTDGSAWASGGSLRGGSWNSDYTNCRSATRGGYIYGLDTNRFQGFRLVKEI